MARRCEPTLRCSKNDQGRNMARSRSNGPSRAIERACWILAGVSLALYVAVRTDAAVAGKAALAAASAPVATHTVDANTVEINTTGETHATNVAPMTRTETAAPGTALMDAPPAEWLGSLEIPSLDLRAALYSDASAINLNRGAVLIPRMAAPGEAGNLGIAAHRDGIFRPLENIEVGAAIEVRAAGFHYVYHVTAITVVERTDGALLRRTAEPSITLVTCYPFRYVGPAPERFVVRGRLDSIREAVAATPLLRKNVQPL